MCFGSDCRCQALRENRDEPEGDGDRGQEDQGRADQPGPHGELVASRRDDIKF